MSRKEFQLIADVLAAQYARNPVMTTLDRYALDHVVIAMADALATTNPRFDRGKFLAACWNEPGGS